MHQTLVLKISDTQSVILSGPTARTPYRAIGYPMPSMSFRYHRVSCYTPPPKKNKLSVRNQGRGWQRVSQLKLEGSQTGALETGTLSSVCKRDVHVSEECQIACFCQRAPVFFLPFPSLVAKVPVCKVPVCELLTSCPLEGIAPCGGIAEIVPPIAA